MWNRHFLLLEIYKFIKNGRTLFIITYLPNYTFICTIIVVLNVTCVRDLRIYLLREILKYESTEKSSYKQKLFDLNEHLIMRNLYPYLGSSGTH